MERARDGDGRREKATTIAVVRQNPVGGPVSVGESCVVEPEEIERLVGALGEALSENG
jgi:hypothetical protein